MRIIRSKKKKKKKEKKKIKCEIRTVNLQKCFKTRFEAREIFGNNSTRLAKFIGIMNAGVYATREFFRFLSRVAGSILKHRVALEVRNFHECRFHRNQPDSIESVWLASPPILSSFHFYRIFAFFSPASFANVGSQSVERRSLIFIRMFDVFKFKWALSLLLSSPLVVSGTLDCFALCYLNIYLYLFAAQRRFATTFLLKLLSEIMRIFARIFEEREKFNEKFIRWKIVDIFNCYSNLVKGDLTIYLISFESFYVNF